MNDFPKEEFANRISKIQENLEIENIEAIIITSPSNFRYFSDSKSVTKYASDANGKNVPKLRQKINSEK